MKDALIGIVLNKVWLIYKLHHFEFGVIYFLFFNLNVLKFGFLTIMFLSVLNIIISSIFAIELVVKCQPCL